jgi:hypothetical protein
MSYFVRMNTCLYILAALLLCSCKNEDHVLVREDYINSDNYLKLETITPGPHEWTGPENIVSEISGKIDGLAFKKKFRGTAVWEAKLYGNKILVFSVEGLFCYLPEQDELDWIFRKESILLKAIMAFDRQMGCVYLCVINAKNMQKSLVAINLKTMESKSFTIEKTPETMAVTGKGIAKVEWEKHMLIIHHSTEDAFTFDSIDKQ